MRRGPISSAGIGAGGGGSDSLQTAYETSNTILVSTAEGVITVSNGTDATDLLNLARTFAGAGRAIDIDMGATTTGHAIELDSATGAAGYHLRGLRNATQTWALDADGRLVLGATHAPGTVAQLDVYRASGSIFQARLVGNAVFEVHSTNYVRCHGGVGLLLGGAPGSGAGIREQTAAGGASTSSTAVGIVFGNGRRSDTGAVGTDTFTSTSGDIGHVVMMSSATPASGTLDYAQLHIRPTFNGTSSGIAACIAVAPVVTAWTGGTVNLIDLGTSSTDYFTGYTSKFRIDSNGEVHASAGAAATAVAALATGYVNGTRQVQTTDATVTTIATIPTANDKGYVVRVLVAGTRVTGTNETGAYEVIATFENDAGTLTQVSTDTQPHVKEDTAAWDVTINPSGTNILVQVTGEAGKTINWTCFFEAVVTA